jgi:hypothetical protein
MVMIDDATGRIHARFFEAETLAAAFTMVRDYAGKYGLPQAIYVDRAGIYRSDREPTEEEILAGKEPQTQFGRALEELGVRLILARSPQAKGRVERMNQTLQDLQIADAPLPHRLEVNPRGHFYSVRNRGHFYR